MQHLPREGQIQRRPSGPDVSAAGFSPSSRTSPPCCGLQQEGQPGETPPGPGLATAPSGLRSEDHLHALPIQPRGPTLRLPPPFQPNEHPRCGLRPEGQLRAGPIPARLILHLGLPLTTTFARWTNAPRQRTGRCAAPIRHRPEGRTPPPLRHPIGTKPSGRADPGKPPPASWQRPARPPARRKDAPSMQPPARRKPPARLTPTSRKNASPATASGLKRASRRPRHPTHGTAAGRPPARRKNAPPPCSLQPKGASEQTPIRLRPRTSLDRLHGRAASSGVASSAKPPSRLKRRMDSTAPSGSNAIRYGNGVERTNRVRANRLPSLGPPTRAHRQGRVADRTLRSSGTDEPCSLRV